VRRTRHDDPDVPTPAAWSLAIGALIGLALVVALGMIAGCPTPAPPPPNPPGPPPAAMTCVRACEHVLEVVGCDSSECIDICRRVGDQRFTDCIGTAPTCGDVDRCDTR
jgi:hypothetical protein